MNVVLDPEIQYQRSLIAPEFDSAYYLSQFSEGDKHPADPVVHYLLGGWHEGLDPSRHFSTSFYLDAYADVKKASINPLLHYVQSGKPEGRSPMPSTGDQTTESLSSYPHLSYERETISPKFDVEFYVDQVPELKRGTVDPTIHYLTQGWRELRDPSPDFSTSYYLNEHSDVREKGINPLLHYMESGRFEGRATHPSKESETDIATPMSPIARETEAIAKPNGPDRSGRATLDQCAVGLIAPSIAAALQDPLIFDLTYYRKKYAVPGDDTAVLANFLLNPERQGSPYFDPEWYASNYFNDGTAAHEALHHYLMIGRQNGNRPSPIFNGTVIEMPQEKTIQLIAESGLFDPVWYRHKNPDVVRAGADPLRHYARIGHSEYKRSPNALFDNTWYVSHALDVRTYKWHPIVHYILLGSDKDLSTHPMVDVGWLRKAAMSTSAISSRTLLSTYLQADLRLTIGPNEFFNPDYYESFEPEAKNFPGGSIAHFMEVGWKRPTNPSGRFNSTGYLRANPDVMSRGANPLLHFLTNGRIEGRNPNPKQTRSRGQSAIGGFPRRGKV